LKTAPCNRTGTLLLRGGNLNMHYLHIMDIIADGHTGPPIMGD
jgi:hypothetical protein